MLTTRGAARGERGAVAIMVAVMASILMVTAALVVDLGLARDTRRQAQNAADASALASANVLFPASGTCSTGGPGPCFADAVAHAKSYAQNNYGVASAAWATCSDPGSLAHTPDSDCISFDSSTSPTKIRVLVPTRTVDTGLGELAGVSTIDIAASAVASVQVTTVLAYAIFAISDTCGDKTLEINGGDIAITGGVHSNDEVKLNGDIAIDGTLHSVDNGQLSDDVEVNGTVTEGPPVKPDPLGVGGGGETMALWRPGSARATALGAKYFNAGNTTITRAYVTHASRGAGVYYTTRGVSLTGGAPLLGVTFIIDKANGEKVFDVNSDNLTITPYIDAANNPNKLQIFTNAAEGCDKAVISVNGGNFSYKGVIYAPNGHILLNGNNHTSTDGSIIGSTIKVNGNGAGVSNDGDNSVGDADIALSQ